MNTFIPRVLLSVILLSAAGICHAQSWSTPQSLTLPSEVGIKNPRIHPAIGGGFHASYKYTAGNWSIKYRRYQPGIGFTAYSDVPITGWPGGNSDITEALNGDLWVTWENWADTEQIWASRSTNAGASWTPYNVTNYVYAPGKGGEAKHPTITPIGLTPSPNVVSGTWQAATKNLMYSTFNGSSWSAHQSTGIAVDNAYASYGITRSPQDGSVYRIYGRDIAGGWNCGIQRFDGSTWGPEILVSNNTTGGFLARPAIAITDSGRIMCIWEINSEIWYREYIPGVGWGSQAVAAGGSFGSITALPGRNEFILAYASGNNVFSKRYTAQKWEAAKHASAGIPAFFTVDPELAADAQGYVYVVWEAHPDPGPVAWYSVFNGYVYNDVSAPAAPASVTDEGATTDSTTDLLVSWSAVTDPESGIDRYEYSVGTSAGATNTRFWTHAGTGASLGIHNLSMTPGVTYFVNIRAVNKAGKEGAVASSNGITCSPVSNNTFFGTTYTVSSSPAACDSAALAPSADGGMHLVYRDNDGGLKLAYRKINAGVWSSIAPIANGTPAAYFPDIVEDTNGIPTVLFQNPGGRENNNLWTIVNVGGTWGAPQVVDTSLGWNWYPRVAAAPNGNLVIIAHGDNTTYNVKSKVRSTGNWQTTTTIGSGPNNSARYGIPDVATAPNGRIVALWNNGSNVVYTSEYSSGIWSGPIQRASHPGTFLTYPQIAFGPDSLAHGIYCDNNAGSDPAIYYIRETSPGVWTSPVLIANGAIPGLDVDNLGQPHVVYAKLAGSATDIFHKYYNGFNWSLERNLSNNSGASERPVIRKDEDGNLHLAWQDATGGTSKILYRQSLANPPGIGAIKNEADNVTVDLYQKVVTGMFPSESAFYISDASRASGIRVTPLPSGLTVGDRVNVSGMLTTRYVSGKPAERMITSNSTQRISAGEPLEPLGMNGNTLGGQNMSATIIGVAGGVGLNNIGQLVTFTGKVTAKISTSLYVDDGSGIADTSGRIGALVRCPSSSIPANVGDTVSVTGILTGSIPTGWTQNRRQIQLRSFDDLVIVNP